VHINALVVWMLYAMIGSVYLMITDETGQDIVGIKLGKLAFWVLTGAVAVVVLVYYLFKLVQVVKLLSGLSMRGREYIEVPRMGRYRYGSVGLIFYWNVFATYIQGKRTGLMTVWLQPSCSSWSISRRNVLYR